MSVDEAMIAMISRYGKPVSRETVYFDVHLGRPTGMEARESALGKKTVLKLTEKLRDKHYHVYFDNYFPSVELLEEFYKEKLTGCGTVTNRNCEIESE